jgi:hypothetical protein
MCALGSESMPDSLANCRWFFLTVRTCFDPFLPNFVPFERPLRIRCLLLPRLIRFSAIPTCLLFPFPTCSPQRSLPMHGWVFSTLSRSRKTSFGVGWVESVCSGTLTQCLRLGNWSQTRFRQGVNLTVIPDKDYIFAVPSAFCPAGHWRGRSLR